jgi:cell division protein FtsL
MNKSIKDKQAQLSALQSEEIRLKSEVAGLTSAEKVNGYVQENGMGPVNSNQIYYIEAQEKDQVTVPKEEGTWFERAWNAIVEFVT